MDGNKGHKAKIFSLDQSSLWIEALVPGTEGLSSADTVSFQASNIDFVRALGPKASLIRLKSGADIVLRLPQPALMDRLQNPDGPLLDLKGLCYLETKEKLLERLREEFKKEAEDEKYAVLEAMTFRAFVRPANKAEFREFTFCGQDVRMREVSEGDSIMGGKNIRLIMKDPAKAPFDGPEFIMEGTLQEMRALCTEAHAQGEREIDLRGYSLKKGTTPPEERAAQRKGPRP